jgi:hypothetical protein
MPGRNRQHYAGDYARRAAAIRAAANADPLTRCWRCGRTLAEVRDAKPAATWDAGHLIDSDPASPLAAECSPCNRGAGARMGNASHDRPPPWMR